ncbi:unnamed protein product [Didymodactylos carnosus]|uniref:Helix-turn-helix domain-containing protein n=1 Tax=Didymodactylos carnosus TaxID=1234261 RepID=A0A814CPP3_9BILA|nr:unnamed protein product [Didymodactylos carnosus]CAF3719942.1 unnamed protein product [Didymodactylos carnosus]
MQESELKDYVEILNTITETIRFTYEYEKNSKINFLDTTVKRVKSNGQMTLSVRWFRKPTAADHLLNYESSHSKSIKSNITKNMTTRILQATKDGSEQKEDLEILKQMLLNSKYPVKQVEKLVQEACQSGNGNSNSLKKTDDFKFSLSLPYVPGIEVLKRRLEKLKVKLYFSYPSKLQSHFNRNLKTPSRAVIYQIQCDCNPSRIYSGETKVDFEKRVGVYIYIAL